MVNIMACTGQSGRIHENLVILTRECLKGMKSKGSGRVELCYYLYATNPLYNQYVPDVSPAPISSISSE
jgi:hypothetical protein